MPINLLYWCWCWTWHWFVIRASGSRPEYREIILPTYVGNIIILGSRVFMWGTLKTKCSGMHSTYCFGLKRYMSTQRQIQDFVMGGLKNNFWTPFPAPLLRGSGGSTQENLQILLCYRWVLAQFWKESNFEKVKKMWKADGVRGLGDPGICHCV